jgi:maltooligosyltrehalose trehalohydrolase
MPTETELRWGAHLRPDGSARFALWAPALDSLSLRVGGADHAMTRREGGWFDATLPGLAPGTPYAFVLPDGMAVPDPASRAQAGDVHGPSALADPTFDWQTDWPGRPWEEAVIYELHIGTFTAAGTFDAAVDCLDALADLGVTAIEIMPVAQFAGNRGWGYDGVLPYCPHSAYGGPESLKRLVDAAHARGLMVLLDVVYNHFGPDGNYLGFYAPDFFNPERQTPWGAAIDYRERAVRDFFIDNAVMWIDEFRLDGLRFDAIDQIKDPSDTTLLAEAAARIRARSPDRPVHLTSEDERNIVALHPRDAANRPELLTAEWNDDLHHALHCLATGEATGYYAAFSDDPLGHLARALAEGFVYQGEPYPPWDGRPRGVPSADQPPSAFVAFAQNHDQIGNRAFGERLTTLAEPWMVELVTAVLLLNPQIPLLFMGDEYGETRPFLFFTDFHGELARAVREGRRREFADFTEFAAHPERIPDPNAEETFAACRLDWSRHDTDEGRARLALHRDLLAARRTHIVPRLAAMRGMSGKAARFGSDALAVTWRMGDARYRLAVNFGDALDVAPSPPASPVWESAPGTADAIARGSLPARSLAATLGAER